MSDLGELIRVLGAFAAEQQDLARLDRRVESVLLRRDFLRVGTEVGEKSVNLSLDNVKTAAAVELATNSDKRRQIPTNADRELRQPDDLGDEEAVISVVCGESGDRFG